MLRCLIVLATAATVVTLTGPATGRAQIPDLSERPEAFIPPPLHPGGAHLETRRLAEGVYALVSDRNGVDNSGFVVGERGVLVIDAHINAAMARQIQTAVRAVTDKPILYLVNTNYHGDHTFGNYAFPAETRIVAHRATAERMREFEAEKEFLLATVNGDRSVYADAELRLPDTVFDDSLRLDLGGRVVELHHFGPGNTPGDAVVYVPEARVAWTGNLVLGVGVPFLIEGGAEPYLRTIERFADALDVETIVPGHGPIVSREILAAYRRYLGDLVTAMAGSDPGESVESALGRMPLDPAYFPPGIDDATRAFIEGLHVFNVWRVLEERRVGMAAAGGGR
ncbi:MAG TPA: MBL fold metallo-hydrolase [Gemmatimonadota bacterium]|nr:MBL fold metallo-hydrolase [Gemmatimonadota bacterium]